MFRINSSIALALAVLTMSLWALFNRPIPEPPWPARIQGFSFSPFRADEDAFTQNYPSAQEIDADLGLLAGRTHAIRTYSVEGPLADVPQLAAKHGINVALGLWIGRDMERNRQEVALGADLAQRNHNVVRVVVGNEVLLRGDLSIAQLTPYLDELRAHVRQPVSTAEPWHVWLKYPELADHVDYLAVHMLPYWEGIDVERAVHYSVERIEELARRFPNKPIVIAEVGWPSSGRTRESAVASTANEALFLRRFLAEAERRDYVYYVMEAFDQPWKAQSEGGVGAYWGVYDVTRDAKFAFAAPLVRIPHWRVLAGLSIVIAGALYALLLLDSRVRTRGRTFLAVVAYAASTVAVWVVYDYSRLYITPTSLVVGILLFLGMLGLMLVMFSEAHEWAEARWFAYREASHDARPPGDAALPMVSIHVPAHDEPAAMLIDTLDALARLDYPNFEVLVVDNNTRDPGVWQPVEAHCKRLGERFRFFHVDPLAGFKAGALNFALRKTAAEAEIIAAIDSDYIVDPGWLRDLVPFYGRDPRLAIVQAPQDYRDGSDSVFKSMMYSEYRGFFYIGMVTRNERNAIIQHGTMTLVRRTALEQVGGWAEWCITEDAELGLRILEHGYTAIYVPRSYGRGLMPDRFIDYKLQRFRWAFGAVRILRHHLGTLVTGGDQLTRGQRYHFVAGWLPWLADGANLLFTITALGWSLAMIAWPTRVDPPLVVFSAMPLTLFVFKLAKLAHLYGTRIGAGLRQTLGAGLAGLALTHTVGRAVLSGLLPHERPFFRTPKLAQGKRLGAALVAVREEAVLCLALWAGAAGSWLQAPVDAPDLRLWASVLVIQSVPYAAAVLLAICSAAPRLPARLLGALPGSTPSAAPVAAPSTRSAPSALPVPAAHTVEA